MPEALNAALPPPGLGRRLAAGVYDALLLVAVLLAAAAVALALCVLVLGTETVRTHNPLPDSPFFLAYLSGVCFLFYGWFWTHGGQTLGMRAWKIRVQQRNGLAITWTQALWRFLTAVVSWLALGLGYWWMLVDRDRLTWHDRCSGTVLVRVERR